MAVRLQMKLGVVAEHDRLIDSPDTLVVVEPTVGSVARSKGLLYLLVTSRLASRHGLEATRLAAETIRNEYYYDESAGIRVCLQKAIMTANKRLAHQADRLGPQVDRRQRPDRRRAWRSSAATRCTSRRSARPRPTSSARPASRRCPIPQRDRGLPAGELEPDVWRGEVAVGDSLVLISPNVMTKLGVDELKDAMLTLHPQSAMEHLHHRFVAADGSGSDGAIAFEASEVVGDVQVADARPGQARRAARRRAGPRPIPLADNVAAAGSAVTAAAGQRPGRRRRRDGPARRPPPGHHAAPQAGLPPRDAARDPSRDAAAGGDGGPRPDHRRRRARPGRLRLRRLDAGRRRSARSTPASRRSTAAKADLAKVSGPGHRPRGRRSRARPASSSTDAYEQLDAAEAAKVKAGDDRAAARTRSRPASTGCTASSRSPRRPASRSSRPRAPTRSTCAAWSAGPDGAPYVLDRSTRRSTASTSRPRRRRSSPGSARRPTAPRSRRRGTSASARRPTC